MTDTQHMEPCAAKRAECRIRVASTRGLTGTNYHVRCDTCGTVGTAATTDTAAVALWNEGMRNTKLTRALAAKEVSAPPVTAHELLGAAGGHLLDRGTAYDQPGGERSMGRAVSAFNAVTGRDLAEREGWLLLALVKAVRAETTVGHRDSIEDLAAYCALYGEAAVGEADHFADAGKMVEPATPVNAMGCGTCRHHDREHPFRRQPCWTCTGADNDGSRWAPAMMEDKGHG